MKLKRILKIVLLIVYAFLVLLILTVLYYVVFVERVNYNNRMLFFLAIAFTGTSGFLYHIKTLKYYTLNAREKFHLKHHSLWILNAVFALLLIGVSVYLVYRTYTINWGENARSELIYPILFCLFLFVLGVLVLFEEIRLYLRLQSENKTSDFDFINEIKGHSEDEDDK